MQVTVQETSEQKQVLVRVKGEIDVYTAPELKEKLLPLAEQPIKIKVDLNGVEYMDSTGLGVFIGVMKTTKKTGGELILTNMHPRVKRLFGITGLDAVMTIEGERQGDENV